MTDCDRIPPFRSSGRYSPTDVIIYGAELADNAAGGAGKTASIKFDHRWTVKVMGEARTKEDAEKGSGEVFVVVAAYGYAYQGHCYRFAKPKLLAFPTEDPAGEDAVGCGFDKPEAFGGEWAYRLWRLDASKRIMELAVDVDDVKALVLEANLPGSRVPPTYRSAMQLAHRNGRLTST